MGGCYFKSGLGDLECCQLDQGIGYGTNRFLLEGKIIDNGFYFKIGFQDFFGNIPDLTQQSGDFLSFSWPKGDEFHLPMKPEGYIKGGLHHESLANNPIFLGMGFHFMKKYQ